MVYRQKINSASITEKGVKTTTIFAIFDHFSGPELP